MHSCSKKIIYNKITAITISCYWCHLLETVLDLLTGLETVLDLLSGLETVLDLLTGLETVLDLLAGLEIVLDLLAGLETVFSDWQLPFLQRCLRDWCVVGESL